LAKRLDSLREQWVLMLHDRRIPKTRANVDHIAVSPAGVFVIDAKRYKGRPQLRVQGGILRPRAETLVVGSRDCSKHVVGALEQFKLVEQALAMADHAEVSVIGMLCFVEAEWPLVGGHFKIQGIDVLWPKKAVERLCKGAARTAEQTAMVHQTLAAALPVA
jgi:hypothetical protein